MGTPRVGDEYILAEREGNHTHARELLRTLPVSLTSFVRFRSPLQQLSGLMFSECIAHSPPATLSPPIRVHRLKDHELRVMLEVGFLRCESQILLPYGMSTTLAIRSGIYVTEIMAVVTSSAFRTFHYVNETILLFTRFIGKVKLSDNYLYSANKLIIPKLGLQMYKFPLCNTTLTSLY